MKPRTSEDLSPAQPAPKWPLQPARLASAKANLRSRLWAIDLVGLRGTPVEYHPGMRAFWMDSLLATVSDSFYGPYISLFILALGGTAAQVGWLAATASLLGMVAPLPGAALTQRWGRRKRMVVVFSILFRLMLLFAALAPSVLPSSAAVLALIVLMSLRVGFINFFSPAWISLTRDIVPLSSRGHYFSSRNVMMAVASMLTIPVAGQLIEWLGAPRGYQWTLLIAFVVGIAASYVFGRIPEQVPEAPEQGQQPARMANQLHIFWRALTGNRVFLAFAVIRLLWDLAVMVGGPYFAVYQVEVLGTSANMIGLLATATALARMVGLRIWGRWMDRKSAAWATTLSALTIPFLPFMWLFASEPWHIIFPSIGTGLLWAGFEIGSFALLLEMIEGEESTQAAAGYATLLSAAGIVGPLIGGWIISGSGYHWNFALSGALRLVAGLLFLWLLKPFAKRRLDADASKATDLPPIQEIEPAV
jgi:MFS family permease